MTCTHAASYATLHCVQGNSSMEEVERDDEDPEAAGAESRVAPALHVPGPIALMITQPAKQTSRVIPRLSQSAKRTPGATTSRVRCSDFDRPTGCTVVGCEKAHVAKIVCREFNTSKGYKRKQCGHLHEALSVALPHLTRSCKYHMTRAGCR